MEKTNILRKLHAIMDEVKYIQKDKKNTHQGYTYASEQVIKETFHKAFTNHGVIFTISTSNPRVLGGVTWIDCIYRFTDMETGEVLEGTFLGSGQSRDEKGHYAAITGAIKYILTSNFLIPTGDDAEADTPKPSKPAPIRQAVKKDVDEGIVKLFALVKQKLGITDKADVLPALNEQFQMELDVKTLTPNVTKALIQSLENMPDQVPDEIDVDSIPL